MENDVKSKWTTEQIKAHTEKILETIEKQKKKTSMNILRESQRRNLRKNSGALIRP